MAAPQRRMAVLCQHMRPLVRLAPAGATADAADEAAAAAAVDPMTDYERFMLDLKGWVLIPDVLTPAQVSDIRAHVDRYHADPDSLPPHQRAPMAGAAELLIDHPRVLGVLTAILDPDPSHLRLESVVTSRRSATDGLHGDRSPLEANPNQWRPHGGGPNLQPSFSYRVQNNRIYAGMTRVVFELNDVPKGQGGTCFVSGSHKAALELPSRDQWPKGWPAKADDPDSGCWETYGCSAGSMVVFSEGTRHTGSEWTHREHPRKAILMAYNLQTVRYHEPKP